MLGYEPVDVVAGRDDACAWRQYGGDLRDAFVGHRRHGNDGLAALRQRCAVYEVDLSADTRIELRAQRVRAYLAGNVDLQRRIDGRHAVVLRDDVGIVGVAHVHHQYGRVVVDEVVDALRTHQERRDHLALVDKARAGEQARLNIDGQGHDCMKGEKLNMENPTKRTDGAPTPEELAAAVEAFKKRRAERSGAAADGGITAEPPAQTAGAAEGEQPDAVQQVKDRRDRRDSEGDPADMPGAMGVIAQQDEDIDTLLGVIDVLKAAGTTTDGAEGDCGGTQTDGDGDEGNADEGGDAAQDKKDHADSANDFRELLRVVRVGDRLNMDGLEAMSVKDAKKAVLGKLKPTLHLDGKSAAYVNAAFDMAVSEMNERKDTNYQRSQMMHGDGKPPVKQTSSASEARQRMIDRRMKKEEK